MSKKYITIIILLLLIVVGYYLFNMQKGSKSATKENKKMFGSIRVVDSGSGQPSYILVDEAQFFTGPEADAASKEDKGCNSSAAPSECSTPNAFVPNGFYIRDNAHESSRLDLSDDVVLKLFSLDGTLKTLSLHDFAINGNAKSYFWITILDGKASLVEEQYRP